MKTLTKKQQLIALVAGFNNEIMANSEYRVFTKDGDFYVQDRGYSEEDVYRLEGIGKDEIGIIIIGDAVALREEGTEVGYVLVGVWNEIDSDIRELLGDCDPADFLNEDGKCFAGDDGFNALIEELVK